jgi:hypothetical protein
MTVYETLCDEFTVEEISEFCRDHYNLHGVAVQEDGISFNRDSDDVGAYGWFALSDAALEDLLSSMRAVIDK